MIGLSHRTRTSSFTLLVLLGTAAPLAAQVAAIAAPACSAGWSTLGSLGISQFTCDCSFNRKDSGGVWRFRGEPQILGISAGGPAEGKLRPGDVIVALDGILITTRAAGERLSNLDPGVPVTLTLRRNGREIQVEVTPGEKCDDDDLDAPAVPPVVGVPPRAALAPRPIEGMVAPSVLVAPPAAPGAPPMAPPALAEIRPSAWFGFGINCEQCSASVPNRRQLVQAQAELRALRSRSSDTAGASLRRLEGTIDELRSQGPRWTFSEYPTIYSVDPNSPADRAGLLRGDVLTKIDGISLLTPEGGLRFGATRPGESVAWTYRRGGIERTTRVTAIDRPGEPSAAILTGRLTEVRAAMDRLQFDRATQGTADVAHLRAALAQVDAERAVVASEMGTSEEAQHLRFAGTVGNTDVEVRGLSSVDVRATTIRPGIC